jgi:hypothetical protein
MLMGYFADDFCGGLNRWMDSQPLQESKTPSVAEPSRVAYTEKRGAASWQEP